MGPTVSSTTPPSARSAVSLALAVALAAASAPGYAQEGEDLEQLIRPQSTIELGIGVVSQDNLRFGQYSGLSDAGLYGLLGADINRRDEASGTWLRLRGRNLGLDSRELRFEQEKQGSWGYFIDFSQTPRQSPYLVNTTLRGIDGTVQREGGVPARDVRLETRRDSLGFGAKSQLGAGFDATASFRHERKNGTRLYGQASGRFLVDPIDYETDQLEGSVGYTGEKLQLVAGYYLSRFHNDKSSVAKLNNVGAAVGTTPVGLPPDNQAHQVSLAGGYNLSSATRAMFKLAYGQIRQEDEFFTAPIAGVQRNNLGGKIDTTLAQAGISSRPLPKLSLRADLRYENRDDQTPVYVYTTPGATSTHNGQNEPRSFKTLNTKAEAGYALPAELRLSAGLERDDRERNTSPVRSVSHRDRTEETSYRLGLRRSLGESVNGSFGFVHSERRGSDWLFNRRVDGSNGSNLIHPLHLADRDRDKVRLTLDWAPAQSLSFALVAEVMQDEYSGRTLGPREGQAQFYSLDGSYAITERWQALAWASRSDTRAEQATCLGAPASPAVIGCTIAAPTNGLWEARLRNVGDAFGVGLKGKPTGPLEVGAELSHARERGEFRQAAITAGIVAPLLPDVTYTITTLKLNSKYALNKRQGLRLQYIFERFRTDDWNWTGWVYADTGVPATTVHQDPDQKIHFIGASYYYQF